MGEAVAAGVAMVEAGADWIDVGGESTRPKAVLVPVEEEIRRVVPVIEELARQIGGRARISVDTYKAETARVAVAAGATVVNDISGGLLDPGILRVAAQGGVAVVLGHLRGALATMMDEVVFGDVVTEVAAELGARVAAAWDAGCAEVWADPGIGFGKRAEHSLALLGELPAFIEAIDVPVMIGVSRKSFIGQVTGRPVEERLFGTAAAVAAAVMAGVRAVRVHDVAEMRDVVRVATAIADAARARKGSLGFPFPRSAA